MPRLPEELVEQILRGNVLLFIGEQLSTGNEHEPQIDDLVQEMVVRTGQNNATDYSFPEAAQAFEDKLGQHALIQYLRERYDPRTVGPLQAHRLIAQLSTCHLFVTTQFDGRLESAFHDAGRYVDVVIGSEEIPFENEGYAQLYRLRGVLDRPASLVLTEDAYETFYDEPSNVPIVLQGYLASKTILFLGYDLKDPHFRRLYRKVTRTLRGFARRSYAFGNGLPLQAASWCARRKIDVLEINVLDGLEYLVEQTQKPPVKEAIVTQLETDGVSPETPRLPYKLLDYYNSEDADNFFGRDYEIQQLTSLVHAHRLILLYGASGTGKTSLLLAGLTPRLVHSDTPHKTVYVRALQDPAQVIRNSITRQVSDRTLPADGSLVEFLAQATSALNAPLVVILDQFEEFFIRRSPLYQESQFVSCANGLGPFGCDELLQQAASNRLFIFGQPV